MKLIWKQSRLTKELGKSWPPALHMGLSTALAMLIAGIFYVPQPYETLVSCITFSSLPASSLKQFLINLAGITGGFFCSLFLLITVPQEPWFYIPLVGGITAIGHKILRKKYGAGCASGFSIYFSVSYLDAIYRHFHGNITYLGMHFLAEGIIALTACRVISFLTKKNSGSQEGEVIKIDSAIVIALSISIAATFVMATGERQPGRMLLSNIATIISMELTQKEGNILLQTLGLFLGVTIALSFISIVAASGNNFGFYLLALGSTLGFLKFLQLYYPKWSSLYENLPEIVAICIVMLPKPDRNPYMGLSRAMDAILGFFIATLVFFVTYHLRKWSRNLIAKA